MNRTIEVFDDKVVVIDLDGYSETIDVSPVWTDEHLKLRKDAVAFDDAIGFVAIGTGSAYTPLYDHIVVVDINERKSRIVNIANYIGDITSPASAHQPISIENGVITMSVTVNDFVNTKIAINPVFLMEKDLTPGTVSPTYTPDDISSWFSYTVLGSGDIVMNFREGDAGGKYALLDIHAFDMSYNTIKIWGNFNNPSRSYISFIDTEGHHKTETFAINKAPDYWNDRVNIVMNCLEKAIPTHHEVRKICSIKRIV